MIQEKIIDTTATVSSLIKKIDSLKIQSQIDKLKYEIDTQNSIATEVNNFYDSAWLKLLVVITILGIVLPIIIQYFQRKNYKELAENLKKTFDQKLETLKENNELKINNVINDYKTKLEELEEKNDKAMFEIDANTYYLQGRALFLERHLNSSIFSYLKAILLLKECNRTDRILPNLNNIRRALNLIQNEQIGRLDNLISIKFDGKSFNDLLNEIETDISIDSTILVRTSELKSIYESKKTMPNNV
jgi:hypothetical protein